MLTLPLADVSISTHFAFNGWLLGLIFLVSIGLVIYLYQAQQRIAPFWAIVSLTLIRIGLLILILLVLLQPALRWTRTTTTAGTLWLMLDDSESMTMTDPQATPSERLHWADALGYLPKNLRGSRPDYYAAHIACLREELFALRPAASVINAGSSPDDDAQVKQFLAALEDWQTRFDKVVRDYAKDPAAPSAYTINRALTQIDGYLSQGRTSVAEQHSLRDAVAVVRWNYIENNFTLALRDLKQLADSTDKDFLRRNEGNADLQAALARIGKRSRADLTYDLLSATYKRTDKNFTDIIPLYNTKLASIGNSAQVVENVDIGDYQSAVKNSLGPTLESTNLAAGFTLIGQQISPDEPADVIVISDGRQTIKDDPVEATRLLASRGVGVYTLMVGSREVSPDAAVDQVDAPDWIYKDDTLRATARIRLDGLAGKRVKVDFLRGDDVIDTQFVTAKSNQETQSLAFNDKPPDAPGYEYHVKIEDVPGEVNHENNHESIRVAIKKDKLYALMIEDQPRWEYQYLAAYLGRDPRVKLQTILLQPAQILDVDRKAPVKASTDNPSTEAQILPETREEWQPFDLIVLGDISPEKLSTAQQQFITAAVRDRGATVIVIAGPHNMPQRFDHSPLADLLPVKLGNTWPGDSLQTHMKTGFRPAPAPAAGDSTAATLSRFGIDEGTNSLLWAKVPNWYWHSEETVAKPNANIIWYIAEPEGQADGNDAAGAMATAKRRALLATNTLGLGRVMYLASDQTWRLREVAGENLQDRFWGQVIRWAVGSDLPAGGRFVRFGANRPKYQQGDPMDPVIVTAHILHEDLTPATGLTFQVIAKLVPSKPTDPAAHQVGSATMVESTETPGYYRASLGNLPAGDIELSLQGGQVERLLNEDPTATMKTLLVKLEPQMDLERRNMNTDPQMMDNLALLGHGVSLDGPYADVLASHLPQLNRTLTHVEQVGFFGDPKDRYTYIFHFTFLTLFVILITAEWAVRKYAGMV